MSNFMVLRIGVLLLLSAVLFAACSSSDSTTATSTPATTTSPTVAPTGQDISGTWVKACQADGTDGFSTTLVISGSSIAFTVPFYIGSTTCATPADWQFAGTATIVFIDSMTLASSEMVSRTELTDTAETLTPLTASGASGLNSGMLYGFTDWAVGVAKDILSLDEMGNVDPVTTDNEIIYVDETATPNTLQTGDESSTPDAQGYATILETGLFIKQ